MNKAQSEVIRISTEYAEACADCEELRVSEGYPYTKHKAAWDRRISLQEQWMKATRALTKRETQPPEYR